MARVDTLTAYHCKFSYLQRNNPLIDEQREDIRLGKTPAFSFRDFIALYCENAADILVGKNTDRAISLSKDSITTRSMDCIRSWYISPMAGKQGQPMTVVKQATGKRYIFGADSAALYNYHIFAYEDDDSLIVVFHRQNSSGCKSVFLETANSILKAKGLKMEMGLIIPLSDESDNVTATKITLQYVEPIDSSDIADNLRKKKRIIRDIGLNLEAQENSAFIRIIRDMQLGRISKETAFAQIKNEVKNAEEFNDAEVKFKVGRRTKKLPWNEFEHIIGVHDISEELHAAYKRSNNFVEELTKLSDNYYNDIKRSGMIAYE